MELPPVSASLGALGSLAGKLHGLRDNKYMDEIEKLGTQLLELSKVRDPPVTARVWMKDVRELSYDMENCVDIAEPDWIDRMSGFKARVKAANKRYDRYMLGSIPISTNVTIDCQLPMVDGQRRPDLAVVCPHVGPFDELFDKLRLWLTDDGEAAHKVEAVVGVGGIGKTTLAKQLWREHEQGGYFGCRAFVRTAKKPDMRRILRSILAQVRPHQPPDTNEVHELIHEIRGHLQDKRYFLIIDDLWATSIWDVARRAFPEGNGSRILTTTEIRDVALACCSYQPKYINDMKPLSEFHSKELFTSAVFGSLEENSPELDEVSDEIIRRCAGLPKAVVSISSVLANQGGGNTMQNMEEILNNLPTNITPDDILNQVLNLCYNYLPSCLQTCLLYLSLYPENYIILKECIMKQWIAEGFIIGQTDNEKMEVASRYFDKLVNMGLIQHIDVDYGDDVLYYAVHHKVHDLITSKSIEENFVTALDYSQRTVRVSNKVSRLSLQFGGATHANTPDSIGLSQIRSLAFIGLKSCFPRIMEFKVLRSLILHIWAEKPSTGIDLEPTSELVLLRYLQVTCNDTVHLPDLVHGPKHLETLEINARVASIPENIVHLRSWFHLRLGVGTELPDLTAIHENVSLYPPISLDESSSPANSVKTIELLTPIFRIPNWIGQLVNLCMLKFVVRELQRDDIYKLQRLPLLTVLSLHVKRRTTELIVFATGEFTTLEYFAFRCGVLRLMFKEGTMPNLRRLGLGFNARRGQQYHPLLVGIERLSNVQKISVLIGSAAGAEESDLKTAEFEFKKVSGKDPSKVSIKRTYMVEEEFDPPEQHHSVRGEHPSTSSEQAGLESQDVQYPPEKHHSIGGKHPSTSSEQLIVPKKYSEEEIRQDTSSYTKFINRMPSPDAASKNNNYYKLQLSAAIPRKNQPWGKKERSMEYLAVELAKSMVDGALSKAQAAIEAEAKLPQSARRDLVFITDEFDMMKSFLNVVINEERIENELIRTWVRKIHELAYNVEDCMELVIHLDKEKSSFWRRIAQRNWPWMATPILPLDQAVHEIEQLKARLADMSTRMVRYDLSSDSPSKQAVMQQQKQQVAAIGGTGTASNMHAVGGDLTQLITNKDNSNEPLQVISVWGTGGDLGITSIIRKAYNDPEISKTFACRSWVQLMHPFDPREFVRRFMAQVYTNACKEQGARVGAHVLAKMEASQEDLLEEFLKEVNSKTYLVVLENLTNMVVWDAVRTFLPDMKNGSWIIVSAQQFEIASLCIGHSYQPLELKQFSPEHSVCALFKEGSQDYGNKKEKQMACEVSPHLSLEEIPSTFEQEIAEWMTNHPLVGRERQMNELRRYTARERINVSPVISVWGIAGVGKSALVRSLYYDRMLYSKQFNKYSWVDVSHPFNLRDFSRSLISDHHSEKDPIKECREILSNHQCLVVIDDLQSKEEWELIQAALVSRSSASIIIVITTEASIATYCTNNKEQVFNVKGLEADVAMNLFWKEVHRKNPFSVLIGHNGAEVEELILKCGGLPKVIVSIATLLATQTVTLMDIVRSLNKKFMHHLETNPEHDSLRGLFNWMYNYFRTCPDSLKPCIFYLSIFPQGHNIRRRRLERRWIAEGYSRDSEEESAVDKAGNFFSKLLDLSIIQQNPKLVTTAASSDTRMVACQFNGFIREYIVSRGMEENLVFELGPNCVLSTQRTGRHLIILKDWDRDIIVFESIDFSRLRSLTVLGNWESFFISKSMRLLRVLDLEDALGVKDEDVKTVVQRMLRLKFLSLRGCSEISCLPNSLGDLRQLQTLDVRHTSIVELPASICKLQKLQYIRASTKVLASTPPASSRRWLQFRRGPGLVGVKVRRGIGKLTALHTLGVVNVSASGRRAIVEELKKLTQLRKLGVSGINKHNSKKFFFETSCLVHLESFLVQLEEGSQSCLDDITLPWENLQSLTLYGLKDKLPLRNPPPTNHLNKLNKLDLEIDTLQQDGMDFLGNLPELCIVHLRVKQVEDGKLHFHSQMFGLELDTFKKVKILEVTCRSRLNVSFGSQSMKNLELLKIDQDCSIALDQLTSLNHLSELKEVLIKGTNDEAIKKKLEDLLANHPNNPVVKLAGLARSS